MSNNYFDKRAGMAQDNSMSIKLKSTAFVPAVTAVVLSICAIMGSCLLDTSNPEPEPWVIPDYAAVPHGSTLTEANTGVPVGHSLTDVTTDITVTEAWIDSSNGGSRVLENRNFTSGAGLSIQVSDFTVRYCKFNGVGGVYLGTPVTGILIQDCEFDGNQENLSALQAIKNSAATLRLLRLNIHHWPRALTVVKGNTIVENCYLHDLTSDDSGAHIENIYVAGGADQSYIGNKIVANPVSISAGQTDFAISAALAIYNQGGTYEDLRRIVVAKNYFDGIGSYAFYGGAVASKSGPFARDMIVKENIFGREYRRFGGEFGPVTAFDETRPGNVWDLNVWGEWTALCVAGDPAAGDRVELP